MPTPDWGGYEGNHLFTAQNPNSVMDVGAGQPRLIDDQRQPALRPVEAVAPVVGAELVFSCQ